MINRQQVYKMKVCNSHPLSSRQMAWSQSCWRGKFDYLCFPRRLINRIQTAIVPHTAWIFHRILISSSITQHMGAIWLKGDSNCHCYIHPTWKENNNMGQWDFLIYRAASLWETLKLTISYLHNILLSGSRKYLTTILDTYWLNPPTF